MPVAPFVARWQASSSAERANYALFVTELCELLETPRPQPTVARNQDNAYVFEKAIKFSNLDGTASDGFIDCYKRGCFVLEAKQGSDPAAETGPAPARRGAARRGTRGWDDAMARARGQAEQYAKALPQGEGWPPFLVVVDVGFTIELYADFTRSGRTYLPFPDHANHRLKIEQLHDPAIRERLQLLWTDPLALDPARRAAKVTREVARMLGELAKSLEKSHDPKTVAGFLLRAIFTMFAEDVRLFKKERCFTELLESLRGDLPSVPHMLEDLWKAMNGGHFSAAFREKLLQFNGGLFAESRALPLDRGQLELLIDAAKADWRDVEPAIFGTLLERALYPEERHKLGAHYTPRAYVERLVLPTVVEPLRQDWAAVQAAALAFAQVGKLKEARAEVEAFRKALCQTTVLDPACGSGNFLYVAMEHLKRLEGEVLRLLADLGEDQSRFELFGETVDPHQFLGLEINPRAAAVADLVLWIGHLQWHFRTHGDTKPAEPVLKKFDNIQCRDAVLAYDRKELVLGPDGAPLTRWDGKSTKPHPVTGAAVPDDTKRVPIYRYTNPRPAEWPPADFIVGNPPFIGNWRMREELGDGYAEAVRGAYPNVPESCDYVMYWWEKAAAQTAAGQARRFGLITTNSLRQTFSRRVLQRHLESAKPLALLFAIPDHPWIDDANGAAVRIAMTVAAPSFEPGLLCDVQSEGELDGDGVSAVDLDARLGLIHADLTIGANVSAAKALRANADLSCPGVKLHGAGFIVTPEEAKELGLGRIPGLERHIRHYRNGKDMTARPRGVMVIDMFGLDIADVQRQFPEVYQWVLHRVKPERTAKSGGTKDSTEYADKWWLFGKPRQTLRAALAGLRRYIATVETAKHRVFFFLDKEILPDNKLIAVASDSPATLGLMSSRVHVVWALGCNALLEDRPVYVKSACFEPFPFPVFSDAQWQTIGDLAERLDAHRKRQQALHPKLTITDMYNVLEKLRAGAALSEKERTIHDQGLVSVLKQIHDDLDAAVFAAYGWPATLSDEEILEKLVALNAERAAEEARGLVRWLRPEFQNPAGAAAPSHRQGELEPDELPAPVAPAAKAKWPVAPAAQAQAVRAALAERRAPASPVDLAAGFVRAKPEKVSELLAALATLGQIRRLPGDRYVA